MVQLWEHGLVYGPPLTCSLLYHTWSFTTHGMPTVGLSQCTIIGQWRHGCVLTLTQEPGTNFPFHIVALHVDLQWILLEWSN